MRDIIWSGPQQVVLQDGPGRLLNSILGLLYLLTISSICYQQRQKNRTRRPTAGEIKGKLGWNFYITLDGGALPAPPPPPCSSSLRFSFASSLINWLDSCCLRFVYNRISPRINIKQSSGNVDGIFAHSRESCKLAQKMNAQECEFDDVVYESNIWLEEQKLVICCKLLSKLSHYFLCVCGQ
jgi:hypothetical protein